MSEPSPTFHTRNGTEIEFVKRELRWEDGHLVKGEESPITEDDCNFMLESIAREREFEALRVKVEQTAERLRCIRGLKPATKENGPDY